MKGYVVITEANNNYSAATQHLHVISEALGHASVTFTMDVYSHIIEGMQSDAMALLGEVLPEGKNGMSRKNNANITPEADIILSRN